ncbi:MAG: HYR domain-containing protein [Wenzhouxiangella sp.]|nr:MAG: HYR domain-containing protein [Wenzhouxiangella sp.]
MIRLCMKRRSNPYIPNHALAEPMDQPMRLACCRNLLSLLLLTGVVFHCGPVVADLTVEVRMPNGTPISDAEIRQALDNLRALNIAELSDSLDGVEARLDAGELRQNDSNLICIGALTAPFAVAFAIGLVPNPPWDYLLGQVPAWAANLGLKFCPPVLDAPPDLEVMPNVDTDAGASCAYDFSQPIIAGTREDFLGVPYNSLGNWTFTATASSRGLGTPGVFHYNTGVDVRLILPGEAPQGFLKDVPAPEFVAEIGPFGIRAPQTDLFNTIGCALDGSVPLSNEGAPCPRDLDRKIRLPVGTHTLFWRAETSFGLLDTLPPIYVPAKPPGSKKEAAQAVLKGIYAAARDQVVGSFTKSYPTGVVNLQTQTIRVLDTTAPQLSFVDPALATFRVEAQEPGGVSTRAFRDALRDSILATDACNRTPQVFGPLPPFLPLGSHQVTWTAQDAGPAPGGGVNEATPLTQTIIVEDTEPPQIAPPPSIVIEANTAPVSVDTGSPQVFDVVDLEPVVEYDGPATFPFGVTVVRWRATDASGNVSPWVEQTINVKPTGTNNPPVANDTNAEGLSFEEVIVPLTATDVDGDELYFYIDRQPDEGFFVAPLLPSFVDDLRVQAQFDPVSICQGGGTLPPQDYVWSPEYVTTDDDGVSFVIDRIVECSSSGSGISTNKLRIARFGPDGELLAEFDLASNTGAKTLSFHPGGLPGYPEPFIYWVDRALKRLLVLDQTLTGSLEVIRVDNLPPDPFTQGDLVAAAIDPNGIVYVTDNIKVYAFDFLERGDNNSTLFLERLGRPATEAQGDFGQAWDMDVDSEGKVYVVDRSRHRIYKFGASSIDRSGASPVFTSGDFIGWLGRCDSDLAPGDAAVCDVAQGRSIGYSCTDATCGLDQALSGDGLGQFHQPQGFAIDPNDILYVADRGNQRVQRFTPEGFFAGHASSDCESVNCFVIGQFGIANTVSVNSTNFYVLDSQTDILHIFTADPVTMTGPDTGFVTYRSNNNFIGFDTFDWFASDGLRIDGDLVRSNIATATVAVFQNQRPPVATPGLSFEMLEDHVADFLLDGSDPDIGDTYPWEPLQTLSSVLITPPAHGQVTIDGMIATYTPDPNFSGTDSFEFAVSDGIDVSAPEPVTIEVLLVPDPPELTPTENPEELLAGIGYPWELNVGVFDPDPDDSHTLIVDWGDGTIETQGEILNDGTITGPLLDFNFGGEGLVHGRHVYTHAGQRTVVVCVTDSYDLETCEAIDIEVVPMTDLVVFERDAPSAIPVGQPISYLIGLSNLQGEGGAGLTATGVTLEIEIDPRLTVLGISGASCQADGRRQVCAIPDLAPIPRGISNGNPPVDRQVTVNAVVAASVGVGTRLTSRAEVFANQINRNSAVRADLERLIVVDSDFIVAPVQTDAASANPGDGVCADADGRCTLRAAIEEAQALGGTRTIALPEALLRLDQGSLPITGDVTLVGVGAGRSDIAAVGEQRLFEVAPGARLMLIGVTLSGDGPPASGFSGLIENNGELVIEDALLQNGDGAHGGAVYSTGTLTVRRSIFTGNSARRGGGSGGAIFNAGSALIENSLFYENIALAGGAITSDPVWDATLELVHVTITRNTAIALGAGLFGNFYDLPMATLTNSILAGNSVRQPLNETDCWNQLVSGGGNIVSDNREGCSYTPGPGDVVDVDPRLEPAVVRSNGRIVLQPRADSPAVDALTPPCIATDLRMLERPQDGNGDGIIGCDIGAFERLTDRIFRSRFEF